MKFILTLLISITFLGCKDLKEQSFTPKQVYVSDVLEITQITPNAYIHTSFLQTDDFGNVPCNGLVVTANKEAIIFDTPVDDSSAEVLIRWIRETLGYTIHGIIPTHFHNDCLGGLKAFEGHEIPSYAHIKTIEFAKKNKLVVPQNSFSDSLVLKVGDKTVRAKYFGEGHTQDNVVGYFPSEEILFGGCLIKALDAQKGYLGDANVDAWSSTVERVKKSFPKTKIVVPGHGKHGNLELLDYTMNLFKVRNFGAHQRAVPE